MRSCPLEREKRGKASQWANGLSVVRNKSWLIKLEEESLIKANTNLKDATARVCMI